MIMNTVILMISNTQAVISMLTFMTSIMNTMLNNDMLGIGVANGSGLATTMRLMRHRHLNMNPPSIMKLEEEVEDTREGLMLKEDDDSTIYNDGLTQ